MASQEDILRIAKILAKATSAEPAEANVALQSAYKRMRRDQIGIRQLLTLPLEELYQESLVKLVSVILEDQKGLSPAERRKAFENFMSLITSRFSERKETLNHQQKTRADANADFNAAMAREKEHEEKMNEEIKRKHDEKLRQAKRDEEKSTAYAGTNNQNRAYGESSPNPSKNSTESENNTYSINTIIFIVLFISALVAASIINIEISKNTAEIASIPAPAPTSASLPISSAAYNAIAENATHAVAALNANLRSEPTVQSRVKTVLQRGDPLTLISTKQNFLEVRLPTGETAFIGKELVIPFTDRDRLLKITARDYIESRASEKRITELVLQTEKQNSSFISVLYGLTNRSSSINDALDRFQADTLLNILPDTSAATWFALANSASMKSGDYTTAYWEARAAIEAAPTNAEHHVAFALASYHLKQYDTVVTVGKILPRLAPKNTNAWMVFGLANCLESESSDELTKAAFILSIKLSRNAENTKKYFRELAVNTNVQRIRELVNDALKEESYNPNLFLNANSFSKSMLSR